MLALRRERIVQRAGDDHLDDRRVRNAVLARIEIRAVHVVERRRENDSRGMMRPRLGQAGKPRQRVERDIHAKRRRRALEAYHARHELRGQVRTIDHVQVQQLGIDIADD